MNLVARMRGNRNGSDETSSLDMRAPTDPEAKRLEENYDAEEEEALIDSKPGTPAPKSESTSLSGSAVVSRTGLAVLIILAVQNCSKNLLMRWVMKDQPKFLTSAAVLGSECIKLTLSTLYILFVERKSLKSIIRFVGTLDRRNTLLLAVPASAYNLQMSLEYVALANLNAAVFSVLVQSKLLFTAVFAAIVLRKQLKYIQVISLILLTVGVMLCNMNGTSESNAEGSSSVKGIMATLGIAVSSGFASVYTEKVIKGGQRVPSRRDVDLSEFGLAYTQVQLSFMSLVTIGAYAALKDMADILQHGLFHNFSLGAVASIFSSAIGGLIVAAVLKYADSVLKGYATAMSVVLTGVLSMVFFGTSLGVIYFMGIVNVVTAVVLYNGKDLDVYLCS